MSTFRVVLDGQDIYDPTKKDLVLYNAVVKTEAGAAGSFDFTMPPGHVFYGKVTPYGSTIEVFEDGESIFYGRPLRPKIGFYNQATYHCEGALAFLNDIHGPEFIYEDIMVQTYFRNLIATHNAGEQAKQERRFTVGNITVIDNVAVYRETSPSSTIFDLIKKGCIGTSGGYLFTRRVNGVTYIDWVADMPYTCNQTVEFAVNLIDMARSGDDDIYTGVMLKGGKPDDAPEGAGAVTAGPIWMSAEIQAKYGNMCAYLEYPDIKTSAGLIEKGDEFLQKQQFESMCFEVTAAEQHYLNVSLDAFKTGQMVYLISNPHFVQMQLPVQSVEYNLNSGAKKVVLGTSKRQTLTKIERRTRTQVDTVQEDVNNLIERVDNIPAGDSTIPDIHGNPWNPYVDPETGSVSGYPDVTLRIDQYPVKIWYNTGELYDWTGLKVTAVWSNGNEEDVTEDCVIDPASGETCDKQDGQYQATVTWYYLGRDTPEEPEEGEEGEGGEGGEDPVEQEAPPNAPVGYFTYTVGVLQGSVLEVKMEGHGHYYHYQGTELDATFENTVRVYCGPETKYIQITGTRDIHDDTKIYNQTQTFNSIVMDCSDGGARGYMNSYVYSYGSFCLCTGSSHIVGTQNGDPCDIQRSWEDEIVFIDGAAKNQIQGANSPVRLRFADIFNEQYEKRNAFLYVGGRGIDGLNNFLSCTIKSDMYPQSGHLELVTDDAGEYGRYLPPGQSGTQLMQYRGAYGFSEAYYKWLVGSSAPNQYWEFYPRITSIRILEP